MVRNMIFIYTDTYNKIIFAGMFVLNLACRDANLRSQILKDVGEVFKTIWSYKVPEEVNEILFCTDHEWASTASKNTKKQKPALIEAFGKVNTHTKVIQKSVNARNEEELLDLDEAIKQLKLIVN